MVKFSMHLLLDATSGGGGGGGGVYSFRLSVRLFVRSFVCSFVCASFSRVEFVSKVCVKVSQVVYISATTYQKAFIFGPLVPWRVGICSITPDPRVHALGLG